MFTLTKFYCILVNDKNYRTQISSPDVLIQADDKEVLLSPGILHNDGAGLNVLDRTPSIQ